jgi:copper transport protein
VKVRHKKLWLILLVLLYSASVVSQVLAHAVLLRSNPQANDVLTQPPAQVELFFSEPLESELSSITVIDSNALVVDAGDIRVDPGDPTRMTVSLHVLADGVYTVSWKALSSIDGHQTVGTYSFAVGDVESGVVQSLPQNSTAQLPFTALFSKFLLLSSLAVLAGQWLFETLVWNPAFEKRVEPPELWKTLYRVGLIGVLISIGIGILSQAGQAMGTELSAPWNPGTGRILTESRLGIIWLARLALAIFAVWLISGKDSDSKKQIAFVVHLSLLFTVTLTSHAATEARPLLSMIADWLHLAGMAFWFGGLVYLFTGIRQLAQADDPDRMKLISRLTSRFSVVAILFVAILGLTGFYSAYLRVGTWPGLFSSLYGHTLLTKQVLVAGLLVIAAINFLVISPRLKRGSDEKSDLKLTRRFEKNLVLELTLAGLLLVSVSFLTYIPPARVVLPTVELTDRARVDDLRLDISISPGRVGQNTFTLNVLTDGDHPLHSAKQVLLRFTPLEGNLPPAELQLVGHGDGSYSAVGTNLSLPGEWQVQAVVRREDKFDAYANFDFRLRKSGAAEQTSALYKQSGLLFLLIGIASGVLTGTYRDKPVLRLGLGMPLSLWMLALGVVYLVLPAPVAVAQINPIPPNSESIAAGQSLYTQYCASCHGATGLGDGPVGLTLNPRPANLIQHAIPGVHSDAQLFEWITNGFPGSQMPPFRNALSDTNRWNLVNFIRTLAPK